MENILETIDRAFLDPTEIPPPDTRPSQERQLLSASHHILQQAVARDTKKKENADARRQQQTGRLVAPNSAAFDQAVHMTPEQCETFIQEEMTTRVARSRWHALDMCFKWRKIQHYIDHIADMEPAAKTALIQQLPALLRNNTMDHVSYDPDTHRVVKLNYAGI